MVWSCVVAWLIADFGSGLIHWWEDRYGDPEWPWPLGPLIVHPNIEHHQRPAKLCGSSYWARNATTLIPAAVAALLAWFLGFHAVAGGLLWLSQANEIHSWAHQKCSWPVRAIQETGLLQSPRVHAEHHRRPFDRNYCVVTDWLNPILEAADFWGRVERVIEIVAKIRPRPERAQA
jgi:hypothetical protein